MMNTNSIISTIKSDIQKTIDLEQQKLNNITNAYENAEKFLLDNGYAELNENDDVLIEIMKCIKNMKEQMKNNSIDISNIKGNIKSLENLTNSIDVSIIDSLKEKIKLIESDNDTFTEKLSESKDFLGILLSLEIVCPACNGSTRNNRKTNGSCTCCDGIGVLNISKILSNESLLEVDYVRTNTTPNYNDYNNMYQSGYMQMVDKQEKVSNKFVITQNK